MADPSRLVPEAAARLAVITAQEYVKLGIPEVADINLLTWGVLYFHGELEQCRKRVGNKS